MEKQQHRNALPCGFLLNEYKIESVLGKPGGFGITYLATDTHLRQLVAIKEYMPSDFARREGISMISVKSSSDDDPFQWGLKCFLEEARVLAKFNHYNIVKVLRFFQANATAYMVMEYQEGKDLADYLKQRRTLTETELLTIILPLLDGLIKVHKADILHRDIKPNNIYIRRNLTPILLDFGSARYAVGQRSSNITSIVTPGYAPIEQYDNEIKDQGPWTDIYALGAVMYYAINGEAPPAATRRVMKDPIIPAVKLGKNKYNNKLLKSIDWALQLSKEDRPQTVAQWREQMLVSTEPLAYSATEDSKPLWSFKNVASIVVILLLLVTVGMQWRENRILHLDIQKERTVHKDVEQQLDIERERRKTAELNYQTARAIVAEIRHFRPQALPKPTGFDDENKYYSVINVEDDDVLNIREFPGRFNQIVGKIPSTEKCIKFFGDYRLLKTKVWVRVQYQQIPGWVNSSYLMKNEHCNGEKYLE